MKKLAVINVVGLDRSLIGDHTPAIAKFVGENGLQTIKPAFPAVTCSAQANYLTGKSPSEHGIVGNGWYFKELSQVWFWRQSHQLVQSECLWGEARRRNKDFTVANLFWWFNMYSSVDFSVTPRPVYRADGMKYPDIYSEPSGLASELQNQLGPFPLFNFWGPNANIKSSEWIAEAAMICFEKYTPTLNLVYLPHLDYVLQREGPHGPSVGKNLREIDRLFGELVEFYKEHDVQITLLSEYGITEVCRHIPINRVLRENNLLAVREEIGEEHFDAGASRAFAVCDHQIAHVYVTNPQDVTRVRNLCEGLPGVAEIWDCEQQRENKIEHERSGDLLLIAEEDSWFSYYWWLDDRLAPDYARTVDIHRKPGYDPVELFISRGGKPKALARLLQKKLGFRYLMDVIPLQPELVKGSHGVVSKNPDHWPVLSTNCSAISTNKDQSIDSTLVRPLILDQIFGPNVG